MSVCCSLRLASAMIIIALVIDFPLYWYQPSFSHEMNWGTDVLSPCILTGLQKLLHSHGTGALYAWTLVTITLNQLTTNYQQCNIYYDILRLHEKYRCLRFINCIGTSNVKSMLIINFPIYWYQLSFSHEMNWVVHRNFSHHMHVFSQNVG